MKNTFSSEGDCNCNMPDCMACFLEHVKAVEEMGCADKELYWEGIQLESLHAMEEHIEKDIPDEIYELKDSW